MQVGLSGKQKITGTRDVFRCPVCFCSFKGAQFEGAQADSLVCEKGHCFDIAAKGYVNFIPGQKKTKYGRELFESRRRVYEAGFYRQVAQALAAAVEKHAPAARRVLDAGCGEGYYAGAIGDALGSCVFALDIEKEAVRFGSRRDDALRWMVADISNIPLRDASMDAVLNIFTPSNYAEFSRVLSPGGVLVKVIPGGRYLQEIRALLRGRLQNAEHDAEPVAERFASFFTLVERERITYRLALTQAQRDGFLQMTPLLFGMNREEFRGAELDTVTIDVEILTGREEKKR